MNANVKCFILCIYKTILKPSKQFLTVSNHKVFSLHALWMTILRPSRQLLTVSNHQVFRFYTLLKLSKVFHPSICSSFVLNLRWLLLRVSRWITNMLVLSKYLLTVYNKAQFIWLCIFCTCAWPYLLTDFKTKGTNVLLWPRDD